MRRPLGYVVAWALATVVATTGAWVGLQPLLAAASPELPTRLSAAQLRQAAPATTSDAPTTSPPESPTTPVPSPSPSPSPTPSPTVIPTPLPPQPATTEWQELGDSGNYERTFVVRGGIAVFHASESKVQVVEHTANQEYEVRVNRWSRSSVILSFESEDFTSRIWVMWRNKPYAEVTESV